MAPNPEPSESKTPKWMGWIVIGALVAAIAALLIPSGRTPDTVSSQGEEIRFEILEMDKAPPKSFKALVAVEPKSGTLPAKKGLLAVVRKVADWSLMKIGTVDKWWIGLVAKGSGGKRPFAVYSYDRHTDEMKTDLSLQNLPAGLKLAE